MKWKVECDFCKREFITDELACTVCDDCISFEDRMILMKKNEELWDRLNKKEYGKSLCVRFMPFFFDRGFEDGYREYKGCFNIPKEFELTSSYGTLDFQCFSLKIFDKDDNLLLETTTEGYNDVENITACVSFIDSY